MGARLPYLGPAWSINLGPIPTQPMLGAMKLIASVMTALVASLLTANVSFADQKPIKDRKGASRLQPKSGSFDDMETAKRVVLPAPRKAHNWEPHLSMHVRLVGIPNEIMGIFFEEHQPYIHGSAGLGVDLGDPRSELVTIELDWTGMSFPDSNWLEVVLDLQRQVLPNRPPHAFVGRYLQDDHPHRGCVNFYVGGGLGLAGYWEQPKRQKSYRSVRSRSQIVSTGETSVRQISTYRLALSPLFM